VLPKGDLYNPKILSFEPDGLNIKWAPPAGFRSHDPHFVDSYMNQWATEQGAIALYGYDPLVSQSPTMQRVVHHIQANPSLALSEYGVKYTLQYNPPDPEQSHRGSRAPFAGGTLVYQSRTVSLSELPAARPMAFLRDQPQTPLPVKFDGSGATIITSEVPQGGRIVLNMLWRREIQSKADGSRLSTTADEWGRITQQVPPGTREVRVSFRPPWEYGFAVSVVALILAFVVIRLSTRYPVSPENSIARIC
jgi:hypothetical protein